MFSFGVIINLFFAILMTFFALQNFLLGNYGFGTIDLLCAALNSYAFIKTLEHQKQLKKEQE